MPHRREILAGLGAVASGALAGCSSTTGEGSTSTGTGTNPGERSTGSATDTPETESSGSGQSGGPQTAVAAQLNVYRTRLFDATALGRAGRSGAGATVAENVFARFENASGEYGAHETLERTSQSAYEGFEGALGELRSALSAGQTGAAVDAAATADGEVQTAQRSLVGESGVRALDLLALAGRGANAGLLARAGHHDAAATVAEETLAAFESAQVHGALESASGEAYGSFEGALDDAATAASEGDAAGVTSAVESLLSAAATGAYAIDGETVAGTGHLAAMQARGYDAAVLSRLGGAGTGLAHATTLNTYRARVADARWLAAAGETAAAASVVESVFAHFEGARAHDALESANGEAYEGFEGGLGTLQSAIESGGDVAGAAATVDEHLRTGITALAGDAAPSLQAGFFRARLADARERHRRGESGAAAAIAQSLFQRFESNELGFHETLEGTSESLYRRFEEEHLTSLISAYENGDDGAVETHHAGAQQALLDFESQRGTAQASAAETTYAAARGFDAAVLSTLGDDQRAGAIAQATFRTFESGAAGYHEALEGADQGVYETFESNLGAIRSAAQSGGDVAGAAATLFETAVEGIYAIAATTGGSTNGAAAAIVESTFAAFENARVHEALEGADQGAYESFEAALGNLGSALSQGEAPVRAFADAALRAQFAVAGALDQAPTAGGSGGESTATESSLSGGPNVVDGVPEDADHVVSMQAVAYEPAELTVSVGDTVAFEHVGGEPHSVTARADGIPADATYWASGGFDSESAAVEGWEAGEGAVQSGQSYVHTFETAGEHAYYCIPHEAAGMEGTIVVEE